MTPGQQVLEIFKAHGFEDACVIGRMQPGDGKVVVA